MVIDITLVAVYVGIFAAGFWSGKKFGSIKAMFGAAKEEVGKL